MDIMNISSMNQVQPESLVDSDIVYIVKDGNSSQVSIGELISHFCGRDETTTIGQNDTLTLTLPDNSKRFITFKTLDDKLVNPTNSFENVNDDVKVSVHLDDGSRGFTTIGVVKNFFDGGETLNEFDKDNTSIYVKTNDGKKLIPVNILEEKLLGSVTADSIDPTDTLYIQKSTGDKNVITMNELDKFILPDTVIPSCENDDTLVINKNGGDRGVLEISSLFDKFKTDLGLPEYVTSDEVSENVTILYRDENDFGYMSKNKLKSLVHDSTTLNAISESESHFRLTNGIITYGIVKQDIMDSFNNIYGIDPNNNETDMNDGDGIIFVANGNNGDVVYRNITYLTLKDKMFHNNETITEDPVNINDSTKIFIEGKHMTIGQLKTYLGL